MVINPLLQLANTQIHTHTQTHLHTQDLFSHSWEHLTCVLGLADDYNKYYVSVESRERVFVHLSASVNTVCLETYSHPHRIAG